MIEIYRYAKLLDSSALILHWNKGLPVNSAVSSMTQVHLLSVLSIPWVAIRK